MRLKSLPVLALLVLALTACSTTVYKQASGPMGMGYSDAPLEDGRYRITFRGRDFNTAYDFALLRAAEITLAKDYTWFRVTNAFSNEDEDHRHSSHISVSTGHSSHRRHRDYWGVGLGFPLTDNYRTALHSIDIQLGKGDKPEEDRVYDAASVIATIGPRVGNRSEPKQSGAD